MEIREILQDTNKVTLSFEVFPPKKNADFDSVKKATLSVAALSPDYMSVTYGAGGGTRENTILIASNIQKSFGVPVIAHLTCVGAKKEDIDTSLDAMRQNGIHNILALRGDIPANYEGEPFIDFHHASELTQYIKERGDFFIGGACYPEGHLEAVSKKEDLNNLKKKVDAGCDFLTTQMFFDNSIFYNFLYRAREKGIFVPIIPGIFPVTRAAQIKRAIELSGTNVPERFRAIADWFGGNPPAMAQAGIAYATDQIIDLIANGIHHIHIYTMNKPEVAQKIMENISEILK